MNTYRNTIFFVYYAIFLLLVVLFIPGSVLSQTGSKILASGRYSLSNKIDSATNIDIISTDNSDMNLSFTLNGFNVSSFELGGAAWNEITFNNRGYIRQEGAPDVPVFRRFISVSSPNSVVVSVDSASYKTYYNAAVAPTQSLLLENQKMSDIEFKKDNVLYNRNALYPSDWVKISDVGVFHGIHLASLEIYPVRYNPVSRVLRVASKINIHISFTGSAKDGLLSSKGVAIPKHLEKTLRAMLLNYDAMEYRIEDLQTKDGDSVDYLMLVDPDLADAESIQDLADYHRDNGLNVSIVDVSTIGTTANTIKQYIQAEYDSVSPPELDYVLLVADVSVIPFKSNAYAGSNSDIWYAWLDGGDIIGDVGLGRLPAVTEDDLNDMINKILSFNDSQGEWHEWRSKVSHIANKENYPYKYTKCKQDIIDYNYDFATPKFYKIFGGDPVTAVTNADIDNAINDGRFIINYRGHGSEQTWSNWNLYSQSYTTTNAHALSNGDKTPVVFSVACNTLNLDYETETLGEAFVRQDQGGVAFLGAIHPSYTTPNHDFDKSLFEGLWDQGIKPIGDLLNYANSQLIQIYGTGSSADANITMYLWLGDPAMAVEPEDVSYNPPWLLYILPSLFLLMN